MVGMQCPIHHAARTDQVVMATDSGNNEVSYPDKKKMERKKGGGISHCTLYAEGSGNVLYSITEVFSIKTGPQCFCVYGVPVHWKGHGAALPSQAALPSVMNENKS